MHAGGGLGGLGGGGGDGGGGGAAGVGGGGAGGPAPPALPPPLGGDDIIPEDEQWKWRGFMQARHNFQPTAGPTTKRVFFQELVNSKPAAAWKQTAVIRLNMAMPAVNAAYVGRIQVFNALVAAAPASSRGTGRKRA